MSFAKHISDDRRTLALASMLLAAFILVSALASPQRVQAQATVALDLCGQVDSYVAPTTLTAGTLVIDGRSFVVLAGTTLSSANLLSTDADICLSASLNMSGEITSGAVTANVVTAVDVCGVVTAYTAATSTTPGSITIGGQTFPIAAGTTLDGQALAMVGADLCLDANVNGAGQLQDGALTANVAAAVNVCGVVTAYTAATATAPGSITIGGQTFPIAAGTTLDGQALVTVGANLCLDANVDGTGELQDGAVTANVAATVNVCGVVTAYTAPTATATGSITIGGQTFLIAAGPMVDGQVLAIIGANPCLSASVNGVGQLQDVELTVNVTAAVNVCGVITAYTAATATTAGSITIGGQTVSIAPGTTLDGQVLATIGANRCLDANLNGVDQLQDGAVTANLTATVNVCGAVTAYTAATATSAGSITMNGQTYPLAAGTTLGSNVFVSANLCLSGVTDSDGVIDGGALVIVQNPAALVVVQNPAVPVPVPAATGMGVVDPGSTTRSLVVGSILATVAFMATAAYISRRRA